MNKVMRIKRPWLLVAAILVCLVAGGIGSFFTAPSIPTWYATLQKPVFNPPSWLFGPVWTALYIMMGIALYLVLVRGGVGVRGAAAMFGVQLILNSLWSILFFGLHSPLLGLIDIVLLWLSIVACIILFSKISKPAAYLLVPYILWVSFAAVLNLAIFLLN